MKRAQGKSLKANIRFLFTAIALKMYILSFSHMLSHLHACYCALVMRKCHLKVKTMNVKTSI